MESTELKQDYLRNEILEKGYDSEKFLEFLTMKNNNELPELENYSLIDLKSVKFL